MYYFLQVYCSKIVKNKQIIGIIAISGSMYKIMCSRDSDAVWPAAHVTISCPPAVIIIYAAIAMLVNSYWHINDKIITTIAICRVWSFLIVCSYSLRNAKFKENATSIEKRFVCVRIYLITHRYIKHILTGTWMGSLVILTIPLALIWRLEHK